MSFTFPKAGLTFLEDLANNNNVAWFQANKKRYESDLKLPSRALVAAINEELQTFALRYVTDPASALNRINRDIRFSNDKTPYNTRIWAAFMSKSGKKGESAGFYVSLSADGVGVGAGCWMPPKDALERLRAHFAEQHATFTKLSKARGLEGFEQGGESYKRVPAPYDADHPAAELLKLKGIHWHRSLARDLATSAELVPTLAGHFKALTPLVEFLNAGLLSA